MTTTKSPRQQQNEKIPPMFECKYFVKSRKRNCKFQVIQGEEFCSIHLEEFSQQDLPCKKRVPCPIDHRHSVFQTQKQRHLKKCSRVRDVSQECLQPFYSEGVNGICHENWPAQNLETDKSRSIVEDEVNDFVEADLSRFIPPFYRQEDVNLKQKKRIEERFTSKVFPDNAKIEAWERQVDSAFESMEKSCQSEGKLKGLLETLKNCYDETTRRMEELECYLPQSEALGDQLRDLISRIALNKRNVSDWGEVSVESVYSYLTKREIQEATIWCIVTRLLTPEAGTVFLELGAGSGGVSQWFVQSHKDKDALFILVDRESRQKKRETKLGAYTDRNLDNVCVRLRVDINDLDCNRLCQFLMAQDADTRRALLQNEYTKGPPWILQLLIAGGVLNPCPNKDLITQELLKLRSVHQDKTDDIKVKLFSSNPRAADFQLIILAKHLCGNASDIALRVLVKLALEMPQIRLSAALAPCCFHSCEKGSLSGIEHLRGWFGNDLNYDLIRGSVGWSTGALNAKRKIGTKVKILLMMSRIMFLMTHGFQVEPIGYVAPSVTLENVLLLAQKSNPKQFAPN
eukprot:Gregarina_sp_Poly_1__2734@NODE_1755_length_3400_cov_30_606361_g171_i2_p1_GENE_NODE_1755_length_3400_cov_30_606361_g171_i2NODE_1755_length_3400_cov_30_606361_g171_i2_p1_ORF_typecomplete_len572_score84_90TRM13/PF05206_14/1_3e37zfTRM13_CCCH/PF11722_8/6_3e06Methyltransf_32/PF13679_6/1_8e05zfU1148K/PF05253_12/6_7e05zfC3Hc3H/PF13891_6/39zfC3Hc3H/PF13891_6/20_NODE_1755_length_3400_cov_30_606361_g171_i210732788